MASGFSPLAGPCLPETVTIAHAHAVGEGIVISGQDSIGFFAL